VSLLPLLPAPSSTLFPYTTLFRSLMQVGGHTAGQAIVTVATAAGPVVLASDAVHYYEELERDRPFSTVASLADMYAAFDQIRERSEEHTSELQSLTNLVCRLLLEK